LAQSGHDHDIQQCPLLTQHDISRAEFAVLHNTGPHMHSLRHSAVVTALAER
jgi:hypothetical protein